MFAQSVYLCLSLSLSFPLCVCMCVRACVIMCAHQVVGLWWPCVSTGYIQSIISPAELKALTHLQTHRGIDRDRASYLNFEYSHIFQTVGYTSRCRSSFTCNNSKHIQIVMIFICHFCFQYNYPKYLNYLQQKNDTLFNYMTNSSLHFCLFNKLIISQAWLYIPVTPPYQRL